VIQNVAPDDYGEYRCEISNGADEDKITLPAHVYRQGSPPAIIFLFARSRVLFSQMAEA